jgi:hypothetical protein
MRHIPETDRATEERDQRDFDEAVKRNTPYVLTGIAGVLAAVALAMSALALAQSGSSNPPVGVMPVASHVNGSHTMMAVATSTASATSTAVPVENLKVIPDYRRGPDGNTHDVFTKTNFDVKVAEPLKLRIDNTDDVNHTITSPGAEVNITVKPGVHTYTLMVKTAGHFQWYCMLPCDEWGMKHAGYMSGYITAS